MLLRLACAYACISIAFDCALRGTGMEPQSLLTDGGLWLWFVAAFAWGVTGLTVLIRGTD